jgi:hypothetical protein
MPQAPGAPKAKRKFEFSMMRGAGGAGGGPVFPEDMATHEATMLRIKRLAGRNEFLQRELDAKDKQIIKLKHEVRCLQAAAKEKEAKVGAVLACYPAFNLKSRLQAVAEEEKANIEADGDEEDIEDDDEEEDARAGQQTKRARSTGQVEVAGEQDEIEFQVWMRHVAKVQKEEMERKQRKLIAQLK